ncbi:hypothetical protein AWU65_03940 [Paenibacillus glucanolyticus]|jgi:signal recognition particle GTPase|uniref:Uncharacterized protein n=1 Tax=Paenibacillus glucanolyticus TaxID=59843 RepID=A0A163GTL3_9BACL|nr:hypothetical protein AWU65_03940 [Paenibacillus glucanolyticus]OMF64420.1 hypothetical protein BK142_31885 [Paenibacillus glucanolyticus]
MKMWDDTHVDRLILPEYRKKIGMIGRCKRRIFSKISIDYLLVQLRSSYRENDWANKSGINVGQLYAYRQFTKYMTIEEKRNPQILSNNRIEDLSNLSRVDSFHIRTLFQIFYMRYRMSGFRNMDLEKSLLSSLHRIPSDVRNTTD